MIKKRLPNQHILLIVIILALAACLAHCSGPFRLCDCADEKATIRRLYGVPDTTYMGVQEDGSHFETWVYSNGLPTDDPLVTEYYTFVWDPAVPVSDSCCVVTYRARILESGSADGQRSCLREGFDPHPERRSPGLIRSSPRTRSGAAIAHPEKALCSVLLPASPDAGSTPHPIRSSAEHPPESPAYPSSHSESIHQ